MECDCDLRNMSDSLADGRTTYERRFTGPVEDPIWAISLGPYFSTSPYPRKTKSRLHQFGSKMTAGISMWYALHTEAKWTGDLLSAEWEDLKKNVAFEVHVKRFKSREIRVDACRGRFVFPCAD